VRAQAIAALTEQGLGVRETARALRISKSLVSKQLKDRYFEPPILPPTPEDEGRAQRTWDLIARAWNGLWRPGTDPDFGIAR
jgi:hypothetical protein